jgi:hypothetical protein
MVSGKLFSTYLADTLEHIDFMNDLFQNQSQSYFTTD